MDFDLDALANWMDERNLGRGAFDTVRTLGGGTQNILLRLVRADRTFVLRRPPLAMRPNSNETMRREARLLTALEKTDVPHPKLIALCTDEKVLGATFYLMEPINGFNAAEGLPPLHAADPAIRHRMGLSMVEAAAALSKVDHIDAGLEDFGKLDNWLERQVTRWASQLASYADMPGWQGPEAIPGVKAVARWLERHRPPYLQAGIIHGDFHTANVMFRHDSGELAAVVDWELCTLGDPLLDLGWLLATWPDHDSPTGDTTAAPWDGCASATQLVSHYREVTGRDLAYLDWFEVLACYKLGILLEGTHARACAGRASPEVGDRLHAMTIQLFERALRRIQ